MPKMWVALSAALWWRDEKMVNQERSRRTEFSYLLRGGIETCIRLEESFALLRSFPGGNARRRVFPELVC